MSALLRLCLAACGLVFLLIVIGGTVRATDSGLGCPDWPTCHGDIIPKTDKATLIEYSHRLTATVVGFLVLGIVITAWRNYRRVPAVFNVALALGLLVLFQGGLGGAVVLHDLPPEMVTVHLGTALTIVTVLLLLTTTALALGRLAPALNVTTGFRQLSLAVLALTFLLMLIGAYMAGADHGLACNGWPLCNGDVVPSASTTSVTVHYVHRVVAGLLGLSLLALIALAWKQRQRAPLALQLSLAAGAIYLLQALIGAANIWTELADEVSIAHLAVGTLLWIVLAELNILSLRLHELLPRSSQAGKATTLAGAPR
jgi:heme A synthase